MTTQMCCHETSPQGSAKSVTRRVLGTTRWIVPTAILALLPKCPMCVVGYVALATGLGISVSAAAWIRGGLLVACLGALAWFSINALLRRFS